MKRSFVCLIQVHKIIDLNKSLKIKSLLKEQKF